LSIHRGEQTAYIAQKGRPLFAADTLISEAKSSARIGFADGSFITLGTYTKLVLDKSVYDPSQRQRESFIKLLFGKARFIVKSLVDFRRSKYEVRTPTAVVGVRGSDFAVCVSRINPLNTTLVTGPDTTVLFAGDAGPAQIIGPMQAAAAPAGGAATTGMGVSAYPPQVFGLGVAPPGAAGGMSKAAYWGIAGGLAVGAGAAAVIANDGDDSTALTVTAEPPSGTQINGTETLDVVFTFSKPINRISQNNFIATPADWTVGTPIIQDATTVIVTFIPPTAGPAGLTVELVDITATDGSALQGQTSLSYPLI
jgi:hypothetical protein